MLDSSIEAAPGQSSITIPNLVAETAYNFAVQARTSIGLGPASVVVFSSGSALGEYFTDF